MSNHHGHYPSDGNHAQLQPPGGEYGGQYYHSISPASSVQQPEYARYSVPNVQPQQYVGQQGLGPSLGQQQQQHYPPAPPPPSYVDSSRTNENRPHEDALKQGDRNRHHDPSPGYQMNATIPPPSGSESTPKSMNPPSNNPSTSYSMSIGMDNEYSSGHTSEYERHPSHVGGGQYQDGPTTGRVRSFNESQSRSHSSETASPALVPGAADPETFEFMKRKRWPQLLMQELVGAAVWCLVPSKTSTKQPGSSHCGWQVIFASPATHELLGYKPEDLEGKDWANFILPSDLERLMESVQSSIDSHKAAAAARNRSPSQQHHYQLSSSRTSAHGFPTSSAGSQNVPMAHFEGPSKSLNAYTRMIDKSGKEVLFELRGHPYFGDEQDSADSPDIATNGGFDGGGVMGTNRNAQGPYGTDMQARSASDSGMGFGADDDDERPCKAFWIMGRRWQGQRDGGAKMLDSFLELKVENERLKQELRGLQMRSRSRRPSSGQYGPSGSSQSSLAGSLPRNTYQGSRSDDDDDMDDDEVPEPGYYRSAVRRTVAGSSHADGNTRHGDFINQTGPLMGGPQHKATGETTTTTTTTKDEKKPKKNKNKTPDYLCQNCGRNDSPEWRKGPMGPKTLCNACGLRWAKRNAGNIPRRKPPKDKQKDEDRETFDHGGYNMS